MKALFFLLALLPGCASFEGVKMNDKEAIACKEHTCSVWTPDELMALIKLSMEKGFEAGRKAARNDI